MTGASIRIDANAPAIAEQLEKIATVTGDLDDMLHAIGATMVSRTREHFETKLAPDGTHWRPLSRRTAKARIRMGSNPADILVRSGGLRNTMTYDVDAGAGAVAWGSVETYAAPQQFGATIKHAAGTQTIYQYFNPKTGEYNPKFRKKSASNFARDVKVAAYESTIPARPYLGVNDDDEKAILELGEAHLARAIAGGVTP